MALGLSRSSQFPGLQGIELSVCGALEEEPTMKSLSYSESNPWPPKGFHLLSHCPQVALFLKEPGPGIQLQLREWSEYKLLLWLALLCAKHWAMCFAWFISFKLYSNPVWRSTTPVSYREDSKAQRNCVACSDNLVAYVRSKHRSIWFQKQLFPLFFPLFQKE